MGADRILGRTQSVELGFPGDDIKPAIVYSASLLTAAVQSASVGTTMSSFNTEASALGCWQKFNESEYEAGAGIAGAVALATFRFGASTATSTQASVQRTGTRTMTLTDTAGRPIYSAYNRITTAQATQQLQSSGLFEQGATVSVALNLSLVTLSAAGGYTFTDTSNSNSSSVYANHTGTGNDSTVISAGAVGSYSLGLYGSNVPYGQAIAAGTFNYTLSGGANASSSLQQTGSVINLDAPTGLVLSTPYSHSDTWS